MDWSQLSVGVAAIVGLVYVARVMRGMQRDVLTFMENHLHNISSSLEAVAINLIGLNERVDRLHDDNVVTAKALEDASASDHAALKEFEERVRVRHMLLAEKLSPKVRHALTEALEAELTK